MIFTIDTQKETDANIIGENFRKYTFDDPDGYGCYSTFDVRQSFYKYNPPWRVINLLIGPEPKSLPPTELPWMDQDQDEWEDNLKRIQYYKDDNSTLEVAWFWDGDGTLYFKEGKVEVINYDCKKDYEWEWVDEL